MGGPRRHLLEDRKHTETTEQEDALLLLITLNGQNMGILANEAQNYILNYIYIYI